jgi:hypothetical protein
MGGEPGLTVCERLDLTFQEPVWLLQIGRSLSLRALLGGTGEITVN